MKQCPYCGEQIQLVAVKCRYCGEWLDPSKRPSPQASAEAALPQPTWHGTTSVAPSLGSQGQSGLWQRQASSEASGVHRLPERKFRRTELGVIPPLAGNSPTSATIPTSLAQSTDHGSEMPRASAPPPDWLNRALADDADAASQKQASRTSNRPAAGESEADAGVVVPRSTLLGPSLRPQLRPQTVNFAPIGTASASDAPDADVHKKSGELDAASTNWASREALAAKERVVARAPLDASSDPSDDGEVQESQESDDRRVRSSGRKRDGAHSVTRMLASGKWSDPDDPSAALPATHDDAAALLRPGGHEGHEAHEAAAFLQQSANGERPRAITAEFASVEPPRSITALDDQPAGMRTTGSYAAVPTALNASGYESTFEDEEDDERVVKPRSRGWLIGGGVALVATATAIILIGGPKLRGRDDTSQAGNEVVVAPAHADVLAAARRPYDDTIHLPPEALRQAAMAVQEEESANTAETNTVALAAETSTAAGPSDAAATPSDVLKPLAASGEADKAPTAATHHDARPATLSHAKLLYRAKQRLARGEYEAAWDAAAEALAMVNGDAETLQYAAMIQERRHEDAAALRYAQRCTQADSKRELCWELVATIHERGGNFTQAGSAWRSYLEVAPEGPAAASAKRHLSALEPGKVTNAAAAKQPTAAKATGVRSGVTPIER